jgi:hypothetical protein
MRIKKKKNNQYLRSPEGIWVRDFTQKAPKLDINNLTTAADTQLFLKNELANVHSINAVLEPRLEWPNVVIVSDGYEFDKVQEALAELPYKKVKIIGVNGSLAKWKMVGESAKVKRAMSFYVANNPYRECARYLPKNHRYFPDCVVSTRTNPKFTQGYEGNLFFYTPTPDETYSPTIRAEVTMDDYRNPLCAAIYLAHFVKAKKILLFCCDDSFKDERPAAVRLENGLWTYPQQIMSQNLVDTMLHWLKTQEIKVANHSMGTNLANAPYIELDNINDFFLDEDDE